MHCTVCMSLSIKSIGQTTASINQVQRTFYQSLRFLQTDFPFSLEYSAALYSNRILSPNLTVLYGAPVVLRDSVSTRGSPL